ncbi:MAG: FeoB-associated Cys-rich membrane protein [Mogibacterium sp.]|nr:FeoB-associated Cys-rich membrane protein [Mogibacterium sp.]
MNMATIIAVIVLVLILFLAVRYIYKEKKKGNQCIGCPYASSCQKHSAGNSCSK